MAVRSGFGDLSYAGIPTCIHVHGKRLATKESIRCNKSNRIKM
jgi:hypothetical protein